MLYSSLVLILVTQHEDDLCRQLHIVITKVILILLVTVFLEEHHTGFWSRAGLTNPYSEILVNNMSSFTITSFVFFETALTDATVWLGGFHIGVLGTLL
jgi:hypothetical protein